MTGSLVGKRALDVGCGSGFFTEPLAIKGAQRVIGLDDSEEQIKLAQNSYHAECEYLLGDMFTYDLPAVDCIVAPFVLNYPETVEQLEYLLGRFYEALNEKGALIGVIDLPSGNDNSHFGARKTLPCGTGDGAPLQIELFNEGRSIDTYSATYYRPETVQDMCRRVGFTRFTWVKPHISAEGIRAMGRDFWGDYLERTELGYFKARKM